MSRLYEKLEKCYEYYRSLTDFVPRVGLILGSGLGGYAKNMKVEMEIPYGNIPGFPVSTVQGHDGKFLLGYIGDVPAVVMKGRVHYYEGYAMEDVVLPAEEKYKHMVIFSHGAWIHALLTKLYHRKIRDFWHAPRQENCGVSTVEVRNGECTVLEESRIFYSI